MADPDITATSEGTLTVYFDYGCPFSFLGYVLVDRYRDDHDVPDVNWEPFDLDGHARGEDGTVDESVGAEKDYDYLARVERGVEKRRERYDVTMIDVEEARGVDSWPAMQGAIHVEAAAPEAFEAYHGAVFEALWRDGRDIGDLDVLGEIAADAGVDPELLREKVRENEYYGQLQSIFTKAEIGGIAGVPAFVYGNEAHRGAVSPAELEELLD